MVKKTVVLTGGSGFIGSHLCQRLIKEGFKVICLDNLITGSLKNIRYLFKDTNFTFIKHDVAKYIEISDKVNYVLHFASPASPEDYLKFPIQTLKVGALGTHNALGLAKEKRAVFMLASTSEVYGDPLVHPQPESYWGNVNPVGVRGCFSEDTEVLTKDGWKLFKDLSGNDEILTLDEDGFVIEYQKPTEIIKERYIGELIKFSNTKIDLLVTPNHKMYIKQRNSKKFRLIEAFESIRWDRAELLKSGLWLGEEKEYFYLPLVNNAKTKQQEKIKMDTWLEFFGYFITEGCTYLNKGKHIINNKTYESQGFTVLISQSKKIFEKRNRIKECLKKIGFKFYEENAQFRILSKQLYTYLQKFGKSKNRYIPNDLLMLSKRQLKILFDAMMLGDGASDGRKFYSSSQRLLDNMQEILLKLGMAGTISLKDKLRVTKMVFILTDKRKDFLTPLYPKRTIEKYNGFIWCINVPNHIIYVRRNGKALWCGNCYDEAKRFAEAITMAYCRVHKIDTKIIRIFNTYGPRMRMHDGRVVPNFIFQALTNQPLTVYGKGTQTRSFCYIDDLIEGILRLMCSKIKEPLNLGNQNEFTVLQLAKLIARLTDTKSQIVFKTLPQDDPRQRQPDIAKAKRILKWQPKIGLEEGLRKTIEWFKIQKKALSCNRNTIMSGFNNAKMSCSKVAIMVLPKGGSHGRKGHYNGYAGGTEAA